MKEGGLDRVKQMKERADAKILMGQAVSLALNEFAREFPLGDETAKSVAEKVKESLMALYSDGHSETESDLKIIAYDRGEELLDELGFGDEDMINFYRGALDEYYADLVKEQA